MPSLETLEVLERFLNDEANEFRSVTQSVRQAYNQRYTTLRAVAVSGFPIASFAVGTSLAIAAITKPFLSTAIQVSLVALSLASLEFGLVFVVSLVVRWRFNPISGALTRMELAYSYLLAGFRTEIVGLTVESVTFSLETETQHDLAFDFHYFHYVFDAALRAWLLRLLGGRLSRGYLDADLREAFQNHIDFMADHGLDFWTVMERRSARIERLLDGNEDVRREVESYDAYRPAAQTAATPQQARTSP